MLERAQQRRYFCKAVGVAGKGRLSVCVCVRRCASTRILGRITGSFSGLRRARLREGLELPASTCFVARPDQPLGQVQA